VLCSPMPSRWWSGEGFKAEEDFFNKQPLLWRGDGLRQLLLPLSGHGGSDRSWNLLRLCDNGEGTGDSTSPELNHADGIFASAILCHKDGEYSTSSAAASRTSRWSSMDPCCQVVRPRWLGNDQRLQFFAGREPASALLLFLGGNACRTPASGGSDA
jgi:hypothetical protein